MYLFMTKKENGGHHPLPLPLSHFRTCYTTLIKLLVVSYWDQPFQPQQVWVDMLTFLIRTLFQPFSVEMRQLLGLVLTRATNT